MPTKPEPGVACDVRDLGLADVGKRRIEWAFQSMPVLQNIRKQFIRNQPLAGIRIGACLHVTTETANLMITLRDGGASAALCAASSVSTQDDVAAALVRDYQIPVFAIRGANDTQYNSHVASVASHRPHVTMDGGAELLHALHRREELLADVAAGTEETTSGVARVRAMAAEGALRYPVIAINHAQTKHLFDNRYGTGQSTIDGIIRATNVLLAGMTVVVAGYGGCGRGVALRAKGLGANLVVTEVDPIKALEALMDGYRVMSMGDAAQIGDIFVTATGNREVIGREHFDKFKSGAILCNTGHLNVEIDVEALARAASSRRQVRDLVEEYAMRDGRRLYVLGDGRLINLAAAEGHPASVMDVSFANHALSVAYLAAQHGSLEKEVYAVPAEIDRQVAKMKLESMGVRIDRLSLEQEKYMTGSIEA